MSVYSYKIPNWDIGRFSWSILGHINPTNCQICSWNINSNLWCSWEHIPPQIYLDPCWDSTTPQCQIYWCRQFSRVCHDTAHLLRNSLGTCSDYSLHSAMNVPCGYVTLHVNGSPQLVLRACAPPSLVGTLLLYHHRLIGRFWAARCCF